MTIFLENQFVCRFSVGPYQDFILIEDLKELLYIESAGNVLPYLKMSFILRNVDVLDYMNEGNIFNVSLGRTQLQLIDMQFRLIGDSGVHNKTIGSIVTITGVLHIPKYDLFDKTTTHANKSSIEVFKKVAPNHFNFITNVTKTNDKQSWIQSSQTDREFLREVWLHSYLNEDTFLALAFDNRNLFLKDIRTSLLKETPWTFSTSKNSSEESKVIHFGQYFVKNSYGVTNQLVGRNLKNITTDLDKNEISETTYNLKNFTALGTNKLNIVNDNTLNLNYVYTNSNTSSNYIKGYNQNIRNLIMFSSLKTYISFSGQFKTLNLLDAAHLDMSSSDKRITGRCFVSRIVYQLIDRRILTNVTLCKEAANEIKGDKLL